MRIRRICKIERVAIMKICVDAASIAAGVLVVVVVLVVAVIAPA